MAANAANDAGAAKEIIPNKAASYGISSDEEPSLLMLQWASAKPGTTYSAGVLGHYFSFGVMPEFTDGEPMMAVFKETNNAVIVGVKQAPSGATYFYGITVDKLIEWKPPSRLEVVDEMALFSLWKTNHADIEEVVPLKNTETHRLRDMTDQLISFMPSFKAMQIRNMVHMKKHAAKGFEANVKLLCTQQELAEKRGAKGKEEAAAGGAHAKAKAIPERRDISKEAQSRWLEMRELLLAAKPFYADKFADRFIFVQVDPATSQPTEAMLEKVREDLACVSRLQPRTMRAHTARAHSAHTAACLSRDSCCSSLAPAGVVPAHWQE